MSSLLSDFIAEGQELLEETTHSLLALEQRPHDTDILNTAFRAMHTLKGDSGFFDFRPMTLLLHAAEDLLGELREEKLACTPTMIDVLLQTRDLLGRWLGNLETDENLPGTAERDSTVLIERLRRFTAECPEAGIGGATVALAPTFEQLRAEIPGAVLESARELKASLLLIDYRPDSECFFRAEDPIFIVRQVANVFWIGMDLPDAGESLASLDPYACLLRFRILCSGTREEVEPLFRYVQDQVSIYSFDDSERDESDWLAGGVAAVLREQRAGLAVEGDPALLSGRLRATAAVALNCLRADGTTVGQDDIEKALNESLKKNSPEPLREAINALLLPRDATDANERQVGIEAEAAVSPEEADRFAIKVLKVEQSRVDRIMDLIGEMVVAKNALPYLSERAESVYNSRELAREIKDRYNVLNRITQEMQDAIMEVRMLPVSNVLQRFPRLVRDLAKKLDKKIDLITEGETTEADKNIIEALADPLVHIIRNSIDHGIESPERRIDAGKPEQGTIRIRAALENGRVIIEIDDDGKGIDPEAIKQKAHRQGLLDEERLATISDADAVHLVFHAGFSTASEISDLSGRGVGMDVVRSAIEQAGGTVDLSSQKGKGTCVRLSLPMSMTSTRVMVVEADGQRFGVPFESVWETVRVPGDSIRRIKSREVFVRRNQTIPIMRLRDLLRLRPLEGAAENVEYAVLVVEVYGEKVGLLVDGFHDNIEVILKPLEGVMAAMRGFSGTALEGNGDVLLILDLKELM